MIPVQCGREIISESSTVKLLPYDQITNKLSLVSYIRHKKYKNYVDLKQCKFLFQSEVLLKYYNNINKNVQQNYINNFTVKLNIYIYIFHFTML